MHISKASPSPDAIWVAKFDGAATIWNLGVLTDTLWPTDQRSHQYVNYNNNSSPLGETYGGTSFVCPASCIDRDIDDAPAGGSNGLKSYLSWNLTMIAYPDSPTNTAVFGLNDRYMGQVDSSGNYMPPVLIGKYCYQCNFNSIEVGFAWDSGIFTSLNDYVNGRADPFGVSNIGLVVGWNYPYPGVGGPEQGFQFNSANGGTASALNAPGSWNATFTYPQGVNDATQAVGSWWDSAGIHAFITDDHGNWTSVDHSGTKDTEFMAINGLGQAVGYYVDSKGAQHGIIYLGSQGFTSLNCAGSSGTALTGINNNGQVTGNCNGTVFVYDLAHSSMAQVISGGPGWYVSYGVNDNNVVAGYCQSPDCGLVEGFYAVPSP